MNYDELIMSYMNGKKQFVVKTINEEYGWYDFATRLEYDDILSAKQKVEIFASLIRINN